MGAFCGMCHLVENIKTFLYKELIFTLLARCFRNSHATVGSRGLGQPEKLALALLLLQLHSPVQLHDCKCPSPDLQLLIYRKKKLALEASESLLSEDYLSFQRGEQILRHLWQLYPLSLTNSGGFTGSLSRHGQVDRTRQLRSRARLLHLGALSTAGPIILCCGCRPAHWDVFRSSPDIYPLDSNSVSPSVVTTQNVSGLDQLSLNGTTIHG